MSLGKIFVPVLALAVLCGCAESENRATLPTPQAVAQLSLRDDASSAVPAAQALMVTAPTEIIPMRLDNGFTLGERAKILRAVNEWNFVLGGHVRFEIVDHNEPGLWSVISSHASAPMNGSYALGNTIGGSTGGLVLLHVDRLGTRNLESVMLHELGHVLGLSHTDQGLMAATFGPDQSCIDRTSVLAVARRHGIQPDALRSDCR